MARNKRVISSVVWTQKNLLILQNLGFLNKRGKSTGRKNLSDFVNRCVDDKIGIENSAMNQALEERLRLSNIHTLQKQRDNIEDEIREEARKLEELRKGQQSKQTESLQCQDLSVMAVNVNVT